MHGDLQLILPLRSRELWPWRGSDSRRLVGVQRDPVDGGTRSMLLGAAVPNTMSRGHTTSIGR
jgi:hypothetical protein